MRDLGAIESARTLEARTNSSAVYALDADSNLYSYRNISWSRLRSQVIAIHFAN
jgi:hypothetical protein